MNLQDTIYLTWLVTLSLLRLFTAGYRSLIRLTTINTIVQRMVDRPDGIDTSISNLHNARHGTWLLIDQYAFGYLPPAIEPFIASGKTIWLYRRWSLHTRAQRIMVVDNGLTNRWTGALKLTCWWSISSNHWHVSGWLINWLLSGPG